MAGINAAAGALVFAVSTVAVASWAESSQTGLLHFFGLGVGIKVALAFLALDAWAYWWHRANHSLPILWRFHRVHHSDPSMDVTTATRFHIGEIAISTALRLGVIAAVGVPMTAILLYEGVVLVSTQFHHANIDLPALLDRMLRPAVVSPAMHKVHHSRTTAEANSNYTSVLSIWDRLFGTYRDPDACGDIRFGLDGLDSDQFQSVKGLLRTPFTGG